MKRKNVSALSTRAAFAPGSVNDAKRTVDVIWSVGARVLRNSWYDGPSYEELSMDPQHVRLGRLNNGAPFLADHSGSTESIRGVVESARIENGQGVATIRFPSAGVSAEADKMYALVRDGILQNISVGYRTHQTEQVGKEAGEIPVFRAVDWEPFEISAVAIGADDAAGFRSEQTNQMNECVFLTRSEDMTPEELKRQEEAKAAAHKAAIEAGIAQERERAATIRTSVRALSFGDDVAEKMITENVTVEAARAQLIELAAKRSDDAGIKAHSPITGGETSNEKMIRGISAWAFEKSGNGLVEKAHKRGAKGFEKIDLDGGEFRGMSLVDIARHCIERSGGSTKGIYDKKRLFDMAIKARGYSGVSDFSVLFENVMYKTMRAAYAVQEDVWRRFCGTDTVQDFRASNRFLNGSFGTLPVVAENAEYQQIGIPDGAKVSITTETRGGLITLSRQAMINDDMGALVSIAADFGKTAGKSIEKAVFDTLALNSGLGPTMGDSQPYFHANRNNISTAAAISIAALDADRLKMRQQMDISSNDYLDLNPRILLVPVGLESAAKVLNGSAFDFTSQANSNKPNVVQGMFGDIVSSPRLTASTTRRYLFTEGKEAFKVVFLEGAGEGPVLESEEGFSTDGTTWKARVDFKVNPYDPKTAITNAGT